MNDTSADHEPTDPEGIGEPHTSSEPPATPPPWAKLGAAGAAVFLVAGAGGFALGHLTAGDDSHDHFRHGHFGGPRGGFPPGGGMPGGGMRDGGGGELPVPPQPSPTT